MIQGDLHMRKTDMKDTLNNHTGPQYTFSLELRGSAVDVILFTNPTAAFYASAHTHSGHEFHYIREGSSSLRIGNGNYAMQPGNCCLVAKGTFHDITMCSPSVCRVGALIIPGSGDGAFGKLPPFTEFRAEGELLRILELLLAAIQRGQTRDFEVYARACVTMLLIALLKKLTPEAPATAGREDRAAPENRSLESMKQEALSYIANNLATASLEALAELLHISTRQTARFLRENLGESFSALLRKHRIECAKALMLSGKLSMEEIAFLSGYQSYKGFHSAFCKYTGINPKAYRQSLTDAH